MAVKKSDTAAVPTEVEDTTIEAETTAPDTPAVEEPTTAKAAKDDDTGFCVYLGPTIHGVIQSGTVYSGTRKTAETALASAIGKYPLIAKLIVTDKTLAEDRVKVKTAGNALNVFYRKLASGKSV